MHAYMYIKTKFTDNNNRKLSVAKKETYLPFNCELCLSRFDDDICVQCTCQSLICKNSHHMILLLCVNSLILLLENCVKLFEKGSLSMYFAQSFEEL